MLHLSRNINPDQTYINDTVFCPGGIVAKRYSIGASSSVAYDAYQIVEDMHGYTTYMTMDIEVFILEKHLPDPQWIAWHRSMCGEHASEAWIQAGIEAKTSYTYYFHGTTKTEIPDNRLLKWVNGKLMKHVYLGDITTQDLPPDIEAISVGPERSQACRVFSQEREQQAEAICRQAFFKDFEA